MRPANDDLASVLEDVAYPPLPEAEIQDLRLRRLFALWNAWCGADAMPEWRRYPTTDLVPWWPSLTLVAVENGRNAPDALKIVVQGAEIVAHDRANHMGKTFAQAYTPFLLSRIMPGYSALLTSGKPVYTRREGGDIKGYPVVFEKLLLPFGRPGGPVTHILNCLYLQRSNAPNPSRTPDTVDAPYLVHGLVFDESSQSQA